MNQTSCPLFSDLCIIIFPICINVFFIYALYSSTVALSHLSKIYMLLSCSILDTSYLCVVFITHLCITLIPSLYVALIIYLYIVFISYSYITLIFHSCIVFFHYPCIIYMASYSLACFLSSVYIRLSY